MSLRSSLNASASIIPSGLIDEAGAPIPSTRKPPVSHEDAPSSPAAPQQGERIAVRAHDRRRSNDPSEPVTPHLHVPLAMPLTVPEPVLRQINELAESNRKLAEQIEQQNAMMQQAAADAADAHLQMMAAIGGLARAVMTLAEKLLGPAKPAPQAGAEAPSLFGGAGN